MKKKLLLIICLLGTFGMSLANNLIINDGITIIAAHSAENDRSSSISASIDGHSLYVSFLQNIGEVTIEISNVFGVTLNIEATETPSGYMYYIPLTGTYTVTFTLENGDEYYGEFEVKD